MRNISVLGSTGSIGTQTLEVIRAHKEEFNVTAISGNTNIELLIRQIKEFSPDLVCVYERENAEALFSLITNDREILKAPEIVSGMEGLVKAACAPGADIVLTAVVGMIGITPTIEAIWAGKDIALANKETLVCAGHIIMKEAKRCGISIYPVDSEHSAIFQCLRGNPEGRLEKIILTASGGPFRGCTREELKHVTLSDALKHPNWSMGRKITIDSSTLVNKGLEVIEASHLFNVPADKIEVVVQPQSIVHSAVQYSDGSIIAQLGTPDMKLPIQYALFCPDRPYLPDERVDLFELASITFEKPDTETFKALPLAYEAAREGGSLPCVFNAANEKAVNDFINGRISFLEIADFIEDTMKAHKTIKDPSLNDIIKIGEDIIKG